MMLVDLYYVVELHNGLSACKSQLRNGSPFCSEKCIRQDGEVIKSKRIK